MTARLGAAALVASTHYASFFLSLETLSLSLITLISYLRGQDRPLEAGVKCLILSGVSSAFLLFGIAILYPGLVAYAIMTLGAFAVIALLPSPDATRDADLVDDYRGLFWRRPALSLAFAAALLSLARIPLTVGFIANHRPGHLPGTASDPDPRDRLHGGALTAGGLQIFHGLR